MPDVHFLCLLLVCARSSFCITGKQGTHSPSECQCYKLAFETLVIYSSNVPTLGRSGWEKSLRLLLGAFQVYVVFETVQKHYTDLHHFLLFSIFWNNEVFTCFVARSTAFSMQHKKRILNRRSHCCISLLGKPFVKVLYFLLQKISVAILAYCY